MQMTDVAAGQDPVGPHTLGRDSDVTGGPVQRRKRRKSKKDVEGEGEDAMGEAQAEEEVGTGSGGGAVKGPQDWNE